MILHLNMKYPVRTIRNTQRRQSFYIHAQNIPSEPSDTYTGVNHVHARTKEPVRTVRYGHRRQSCTRKHEIARPNHQKETPASIVLPLRTRARVTVLKNHEGGHAVFYTRPNMACKRRRWRGPKSGAVFMRVACHQSWRFTHAPAAQVRRTLGGISTLNVHAEQQRVAIGSTLRIYVHMFVLVFLSASRCGIVNLSQERNTQ